MILFYLHNIVCSLFIQANRYDDDEYNADDDEEVGLATPGYSPTDIRQPFTSWLAANISKVILKLNGTSFNVERMALS